MQENETLLWPLNSFYCDIWCVLGDDVLDVVMAMAEGRGGDPAAPLL